MRRLNPTKWTQGEGGGEMANKESVCFVISLLILYYANTRFTHFFNVVIRLPR